MTRAALLLTAAFAGCSAAPHPSASLRPSGFDAAAWLVRARAADAPPLAEDDTTALEGAYEARLALEKRLTDELDPATGWMRACDTYWDPETGREVTELTEPGGGHGLRGTYDVATIAPGEAVAIITCDFGAYQGSYVLVHIEGARATLLRSVDVDLDGQPVGPPSAVFSTPSVEDGSRLFTTFAAARGPADCGLLARYRLGAGSEATLVEARGRDCDDRPESAPPAEDWPVVFPR